MQNHAVESYPIAHHAFEAMMREHNGRLFRVARSILKDDAEAEDALQDAYVDAYRHMSEFRGEARLSTWLTRIVVNHSLMRLRRRHRDRNVVPFTRERDDTTPVEETVADERAEAPSTSLLRAELRRLLEKRIDALPDNFRSVFVMRDIEGLSIEETADVLGIPSATVRTRLFRARAMLRRVLTADIGGAASDIFAFDGARCDRIVAAVLQRIS